MRLLANRSATRTADDWVGLGLARPARAKMGPSVWAGETELVGVECRTFQVARVMGGALRGVSEAGVATRRVGVCSVRERAEREM